ncbi:MAG: hypothetical protein AAF138_10670 [Planctomycetota bacterium]
MTQPPNLIPSAWIERRQAAARRRLWTCVSIPALLAAAALIVWCQWNVGWYDARAEVRLDDTAGRRAALVADLISMRDRHEAAVQARTAEGLLSRQPDWSLLLAIVSDACGEDVTLTFLKVTREGPRSSIELIGEAASPMEAAGLALRLESLGLFRAVRPGETVRTTNGRVRFELSAQLRAEEPNASVAGADGDL